MQLFGVVMWAGQYVQGSDPARYLTTPVYGVDVDDAGNRRLLVLDEEGGSFLTLWFAEQVVVLRATREEVSEYLVQFEEEASGAGKPVFIDGVRRDG
jgi:hypothetical protein